MGQLCGKKHDIYRSVLNRARSACPVAGDTSRRECDAGTQTHLCPFQYTYIQCSGRLLERNASKDVLVTEQIEDSENTCFRKAPGTNISTIRKAAMESIPLQHYKRSAFSSSILSEHFIIKVPLICESHQTLRTSYHGEVPALLDRSSHCSRIQQKFESGNLFSRFYDYADESIVSISIILDFLSATIHAKKTGPRQVAVWLSSSDSENKDV